MRRLTAALATAALGLSLALQPTASATAATGSVTVHNTCGHRATVSIYRGSQQIGTASIAAGGRQSWVLTAGYTYGITTSPTMTYITVRERVGQAVRLCRN